MMFTQLPPLKLTMQGFKPAMHGATFSTNKAQWPVTSASPLSSLTLRADIFIKGKHAAAVAARPITFGGHTTPLHTAVRDFDTRALEALLTDEHHRAALNSRDEAGYAPLHIAAKNGNWEAMAILLGTHGIDTERKTRKGGRTVEELARAHAEKYGDRRNLRALSMRGSTLHYAVSMVRLEEMKRIIRQTGQRLHNAQDREGNTPLHLAAANGNVPAVQILLSQENRATHARPDERRPFLNMKDQWGYTPLHRAAAGGHYNVMEILLGTHGINTELKTNSGKTVEALATTYAVNKGDMSVLELLEMNRSTLHHAANEGRIDEMRHILHDIDYEHLNAQDRDGNTPLHLAAKSGNLDAVKLLMSKDGIDTFARNYDEQSAHNLAHAWERWPVVEYMNGKLGMQWAPRLYQRDEVGPSYCNY
jgi:ankyrin repeat protein